MNLLRIEFLFLLCYEMVWYIIQYILSYFLFLVNFFPVTETNWSVGDLNNFISTSKLFSAT